MPPKRRPLARAEAAPETAPAPEAPRKRKAPEAPTKNDPMPAIGASASASARDERLEPAALSAPLKRLLLLPKSAQGSEAWHAERDEMDVTGSDAACCLKGTIYYSVFKTRDALFREKTKQRARGGAGAAAAHGSYYENEALDKYCALRGERALVFGLVPHPVHRWMGASPDAVTLSNRLVEIKVCFLYCRGLHANLCTTNATMPVKTPTPSEASVTV